MPAKNRYRGAFNARVYASRTVSCFLATDMPNLLLQVQHSCFGWFHAISQPHLTCCKNRYRGTFNARVCASRTVSCFFCSKHALSTSISLKLMFWMVSCHLFSHLTRCRNQHRVAFKSRVCASETISCLVATNMLNP